MKSRNLLWAGILGIFSGAFWVSPAVAELSSKANALKTVVCEEEGGDLKYELKKDSIDVWCVHRNSETSYQEPTCRDKFKFNRKDGKDSCRQEYVPEQGDSAAGSSSTVGCKKNFTEAYYWDDGRKDCCRAKSGNQDDLKCRSDKSFENKFRCPVWAPEYGDNVCFNKLDPDCPSGYVLKVDSGGSMGQEQKYDVCVKKEEAAETYSKARWK